MNSKKTQEREIRLKTMLLMTGMDHLIDLLDEETLDVTAPFNSNGEAEIIYDSTDGTGNSKNQVSREFLTLFVGIIQKLNSIDDKLRSIQTAHFALQHSCSSANEVVQVALQNYQRGNPYLTKIDDILSHQSEHDLTDSIISDASYMVSSARRDTENFIRVINGDTAIDRTCVDDDEHRRHAAKMPDKGTVEHHRGSIIPDEARIELLTI